MRRRLAVPFLTLALVLGAAPRASADVTAFLGITSTPQNRPVRGLAIGGGLLVVGFEFEYANISEDLEELLPSLQTGSGNVLLQTPVEVARMQFYGTIGGGVYRERLEAIQGTLQETHVATNIGGGVKLRLAGPLRLRLDYRAFRLNGEPTQDTYQRFYAGANLSF